MPWSPIQGKNDECNYQLGVKWKNLSLSSVHNPSLDQIRHSGHFRNSGQILMHSIFYTLVKVTLWVWIPIPMQWVESKLPGSAILDMNGEYLLPPFTWARLFLRHYVFRVSYDLFFIFSWPFLSKNGSISVLLSKWNPTAHPVFKSNQHSTPSPFGHLRCNNLNVLGGRKSH